LRRALLLSLLAAALWVAWHAATRLPLRSPADPAQRLVVPEGASAESIAGQLRALGVIRHPALFQALVLVRGVGARLRAGEYSLDGPLTLDQIVDRLARGEVVRRELTVPEGRNLEETAELASAQGLPVAEFLAAARDPAAIRDLDGQATDLEGYLFPDTYDVSRGPDAAAALVGRMVRRFRDVIAPDLAAITAGGHSVRDVVTLASLVELETARGDERPRIAAVFLNRLRKGMPLQTDPTVIFALRKAGHWDGNIRKRDLDIDSPYNTYRYGGLPPGPIASPGREAIRAVIDPAPVRDLYFVSRNDGTHHFSETLAEHERAVTEFQRRRGPSGGRGGR
jgi:UPF0755 protein